MKKIYTGYRAYSNAYGELLIGNELINNHYEVYLPPVTSYSQDCHTDILRYKASDLLLQNFLLDLNKDDSDDFIDDVEIFDYMGFDYNPGIRFYVGSPTGKKQNATYENDWSTMETSHMLRVSKENAIYHGFAFDNGVYADFSNKRAFDETHFEQKLNQLERSMMFPDFIAVPDIVGGGLESLAYSVDYMRKLDFCQFPKYLVVQDGMTVDDVEPYLNRNNNKEKIEFDGIFVGGKPTFKGFGQPRSKELEWKLKTAKSWVELAHKHGKKCHIGRTSSKQRLEFFRLIGADSCDTSIVNFDPKEFKKFEKSSRQGIFEF